MGYIYKITNQLNQKSYIGQTITPIKNRMYKHYSHSKVATTGIDYAIKKYGQENFIVEEICECDDSQLDELETYYIQYYNTYNNGYNLTTGGQDSTTQLLLDTDEIISKYLSGKTIIEISKEYNCCEKTISNLLHSNHIEIRHQNNEQNIIGKGKQFQIGEGCKAVYIQELDLHFDSLKDCAQWLLDNGYSKASSMEYARKGLSSAMRANKPFCKLHIIYI